MARIRNATSGIMQVASCPVFPARLVAFHPPLAADFPKNACDLTPTWSHLQREAGAHAVINRAKSVGSPPGWSQITVSQVLSTDRPVSRIYNPPAWSHLDARLVVLRRQLSPR